MPVNTPGRGRIKRGRSNPQSNRTENGREEAQGNLYPKTSHTHPTTHTNAAPQPNQTHNPNRRTTQPTPQHKTNPPKPPSPRSKDTQHTLIIRGGVGGPADPP